MTYNLGKESADVIKNITARIIDFQCNGEFSKLHEQLNEAVVTNDNENVNIKLFCLNGIVRQFNASLQLEIEAKINDIASNPLHAIVYIDKSRDLLALEVFPWDRWSGPVDINSITPVKYDDQGISSTK